MTWTGYPSYRDSGVSWLDDVPQDWSVRRLKTVLAEPLTYGANESADEANPSDPRFVRITDIADDGSLKPETFRSLPAEKAGPYMLQDGDLLFARSGATVGKSVLYSNTWGPCCFAGYLIRGRLDRRTVLPRYVRYYSESIPYWQYISAEQIQATIQNVSAERYGSLPIPIPDLASQERIVQFLDREITKVDSLIGKQEELIATLREDRTATITHAVTKGLNPEVDMRDSGVRWLGEVPAHWAVHRIKRSVESARNGIWGSDPDGGIEDIRCVRVADFDRPRLTIHDRDVTLRKVTASERKNRVLRRGDLLLEKSGGGDKNPVGFVALYDSDEPAVCSNFVARVELSPGQHPKFWTYVHHCLYSSRLTYPSIKQNTGIQNLDQQSYFNERAGFPPMKEQAEIVTFLDERCERIDAFIAKADAVIDTLREYRSALITDAVTGKIHVRGAA